MRAHNLVDDMNEIERLAWSNVSSSPRFSERVWNVAKGAAGDAVNIDRGNTELAAEVVGFGRQLFMAGLFKLPFVSIWIVQPNGFLSVLAFDDGFGKLGVVLCHPSLQIRQTNRTYLVPLVVGLVELNDNPSPNPPIIETIILSEGISDIISSIEIDFDEMMYRALDCVLGTVALLGMKQVTKATKEPPRVLNKERAKKGKAAINTTIQVRLNVTEYEHSQLGDGRKSPSPHWRRGHIRHLSDGRLIAVSPSLVAFDGTTAKPVPKDYVVKGAA